MTEGKNKPGRELAPELAPELAKDAEKVAALVTAARHHLSEGKMVDLTALEGKVRTFCEAIADATEEETRGLKTTVEEILGGLDILEAELTDQLRGLKDQMEGTYRQKAVDAYSHKEK